MEFICYKRQENSIPKINVKHVGREKTIITTLPMHEGNDLTSIMLIMRNLRICDIIRNQVDGLICCVQDLEKFISIRFFD